MRVNFTVKGEPGGGGGGGGGSGLSARGRDVSAMVASFMVLVIMIMSDAAAHTAAMVMVSKDFNFGTDFGKIQNTKSKTYRRIFSDKWHEYV